MGRRLRSALDRLKPNLNRKMEVKQESFHKIMRKSRLFSKGDGVYVKNFSSGPKWLSGQVSESTGPVSYVILLTDGRSLRRHVDHIRRKMDIDDSYELPDTGTEMVTPETMHRNFDQHLGINGNVSDGTNLETEINVPIDSYRDVSDEDEGTAQIDSPGKLRKSTRERYKPVRYGNNIYERTDGGLV